MLNQTAYQSESQSAGILLVMQGDLKIQEKSTALTLKQGESAFITADSNVEIMSEKGGYAFLQIAIKINVISITI